MINNNADDDNDKDIMRVLLIGSRAIRLFVVLAAKDPETPDPKTLRP